MSGSAETTVHIGIDVGTTATKVGVFGNDGRLRAGVSAPMPPLRSGPGGEVTQPISGVLTSVERATERALRTVSSPVGRVALTTQRDTLILMSEDGEPLTPLISWRDRREDGYSSVWEAIDAATLSDGPFLDPVAKVLSLPSFLCERWTGVATESTGGLSRHLDSSSLDVLSERLGRTAKRARILPTGSSVGRIGRGPLRTRPLYLSSGDKNCEWLALLGRAEGVAGLSLGSAISLGVPGRGTTVAASPADGAPVPRGVARTGSARPGMWDLETGLVTGMDWGQSICTRLGAEPVLSNRWIEEGWCLPHFRGALDDPDARGLFYGSAPLEVVYDLWAQGVLCEIRRLLPRIESVLRSSVESIVLGGGGALSEEWSRRAARILDRPIRSALDRQRGAWGAVASSLFAEPAPWGDAFLRGGEHSLGGPVEASRSDVAAGDAYFERFLELFQRRRDGR